MFIATLLALGPLPMMAACSPDAPDQGSAEDENGVPGMTVSDARLVLPPVAGNPAAVYFNLAYDGDRALTIRRADVADAGSATLHEYGEYEGKTQMMEALPIGITKGDTVTFEPGSTHVMAFDVSPDLAAGDTTQVTLTVSGGGTHTFEAEVRAAGEER